MRKVIPLSFVLLVLFSSVVFGQTSTRAEFQEYCKAWEGRWIGDVTWIADWPGMGKKGDKVTGYFEARIVADGNALSGTFYAGNGMETSIHYFDPGTKRIKAVAVSSGGTLFNWVVFKKDGKWQTFDTESSLPDGRKIEGKGSFTISNGGNTIAWSGTGTIGGEKSDPWQDVWRRVSK